MSRIAKKIKEMKNIKDREQWKEGKKVTVTTRLDVFTLFCLDKIVENVGGTRTSNAVNILEEGIFEGIAALGYDFESLQSEYMRQDGGGLFLDGVKADPSEVSDMLANPEKYGIPVGQMTEEEIELAEEMEEAKKNPEVK